MGDREFSFFARGMECGGCERAVEAAVLKLFGVTRVKADYATGKVTVAASDCASLEDIMAAVEGLGYQARPASSTTSSSLWRVAGPLLGLLGIGAIVMLDGYWFGGAAAPDVSKRLGLGLIFLLGLLTGFHCVSMCGGFVLGYVAHATHEGHAAYAAHLLYGAGKTLSYTLIGAAFGAFGSAIAFTPGLRGAVGIAAGLFLVVFGLNMLGFLAPLRRLRLAVPQSWREALARRARGEHRPFVIGLLNGLMIACGPLQAMYVMAAGSGGALEGAKMLFVFGVGTLPVMLAFGLLSSMISASLAHRLLTVSGVIVVTLGAVMMNRGAALSGAGYDVVALSSRLSSGLETPAVVATPAPRTAPSQIFGAPHAPAAPTPPFQTINMTVSASGFSPNRFVLTRGVLVKWVINGKEVTSCNKRIIAPGLDLEIDVKPGVQTIEFTPRRAGIIRWSCWMGMMLGEFKVVEPEVAPVVAAPTAAVPEARRLYTLRAGDTLNHVAKKTLGDARRWRELLDANPGIDARRLKPGETLRLPPEAAAKSP